METILEIKDITKKYDGFTLDIVSILIPEGVIMGFIGENGAGKTTTLKAILNLIKIDSGTIKIFNKDIHTDEKTIKEDIGVVFSDSSFPENLNAMQINNIMKDFHPHWDNTLYYQYLKDFDLPTKKRIKEFSKGMKMKLSIACALAHHPKLLILDEATSGLDPIVRDDILSIFQQFIQDEHHSVFLSTHITSDIEKIADYITFIHKGKIILSEEKDALLENYAILKIDEESSKKIDSMDVEGIRKSSFGAEVLINNKEKVQKQFPSAVFDHVTLEDIMLFKIKGGK
ncbi:MAG: ABC transporter ATP-binding protein [Longicatena sp.]